jgi:hypothetical protein
VGVGSVGAGFMEWSARVGVAAFVGAGGFGSCVFRAGVFAAAAGVGAEGPGAASFGAGSAGFDSAGFDSAEERNSDGSGHGALLSSWRANLIVRRRRRGLVRIDLIVVGRAFIRARLVFKEYRRTGFLIIPMTARGPASGDKGSC